MKKQFRYTQFTPGHIAIPVKNAAGEVEMTVPDKDAIAAALKTNAEHDAAVKAKFDAPKSANKRQRLVVPPLVPVPKPEHVVTDLIMEAGEVYELDEEQPEVKAMVKLGILVVVATEEKAEEKKPTGKKKTVKAKETEVPAEGDGGASGTGEGGESAQ